MAMKTTKGRTKPGGGGQPDTFRIRLVWWVTASTAANKGWGKEPPHCREVTVKMLGVWSPRKTRFTVHAVFPTEQLPPMNNSSRAQFIRAARDATAAQLGVPVEGVAQDIVDWEATGDDDE
jgi:hypothetical protein